MRRPMGIHPRNANGIMAALTNDQVKHVPEILASREVTHPPLNQNATTRESHWQQSVEMALERAGSGATVSRGKLTGFLSCLVAFAG